MATWGKIGYTDEINDISYTILDKTDDYEAVVGDLEKCISMTAASAKSITLPDVSISYLGRRIRGYNLGTSTLTIYPYSEGSINGEDEISSDIPYAFVELVITAANTWVIDSVGPGKIKSDNYYGTWLVGSV